MIFVGWLIDPVVFSKQEALFSIAILKDMSLCLIAPVACILLCSAMRHGESQREERNETVSCVDSNCFFKLLMCIEIHVV